MQVTANSSLDEVQAWAWSIAGPLLVPMADITVSEWADGNRILSGKAAAEPGPWRTDRTPYLREIMDALSADSPYEWVVFAKGAQVGGTEAGLNWLGYIIDRVPGPTMLVWPTESDIKSNVRIRVDPFFETTRCVGEKIGEGAGPRDAANNQFLKEFPGGFLAFAASNSTAQLRSKPVRFLVLDEVDEYPGNANQQGDPITLAEARTRTFGGRRKIYAISTPTVKGASRIERLLQTTDMRRYYVPCPHCGGYQVLTWSQMRHDPHGSEVAYYECEFCSERIYNHHKTWMLGRGEWRPERDCENPRRIGFHLSGLYSPVGMMSWSDCMRDYLDAQKDPLKLQAWTNTVLGESYEEKGERPEWERLFNRREDYEIETAPDGVLLITAGVDVQKDRIEAEVVGWGRGKESWSIGYYVFEGDTSDLFSEAWNGLRDLLSKGFVHQATGVVLNIELACIDAGYATTVVYQFGRELGGEKVAVIKGQDAGDMIVGNPKHADIKLPNGRVIKNALLVRNVNVSKLKHELYGWLRMETPENGTYPPGYVHFPGYQAEYFRQLTAEQWVTTESRTTRKVTGEWKKTRDRNEALDARIYARAAAYLRRIDLFQSHHWDRLEKAVGSIRDPRQEATSDGPADRESRHRRYRSRGIQ